MVETSDSEPEYDIVPVVVDGSVVAGQEIQIDVFFTGSGVVTGNQFDVFPANLDLTPDDPGEIEISIAIDDEGEIVTGLNAIEDPAIQTDYDLSSTGVKFGFSNRFFTSKEETPENELLDLSFIEDTHDDKAPFSVTLNTSEAASPGNYDIVFVFTYWSDSTIKKTRRDTSVHVKTRREELEPLPTYAVIAAAFIAFLSLILSTELVDFVLNALQELPIDRLFNLSP